MDNKRYKISISMITGLVVVAGGLFGYQNFYSNKQQLKNQTTIYVAKSDIQAKTKVNANMLESKSIPTSGVLSNYVTSASLKDVVGKELKGGLLKGEPLTTVRVNTEKSDLKSNLTVKLEPDFPCQIQPNDNVNVYVVLANKNTGEVTVKDLLSNKKVYSPDTASQNGVVNVNSGNSEAQKNLVLVRVTDEELQIYYKAKASGRIVVSKVTDLDTKEISSKNSVKESASDKKTDNKYDANSVEAQSSYKPTNNSNNSVAVEVYTVQEGDNVDSLCKKFKTSKDVISKLNNNNTEFKTGEKIIVPAI